MSFFDLPTTEEKPVTPSNSKSGGGFFSHPGASISNALGSLFGNIGHLFDGASKPTFTPKNPTQIEGPTAPKGNFWDMPTDVPTAVNNVKSKPGFLDKLSSFNPVAIGNAPDDSAGGIFRNTITGLPKAAWDFLGIGKIQDYLKTPEGEEAAMNLTAGDVAKNIIPTVASVPLQIASDFTGKDINLKSNAPKIAGDIHIQSIQNATRDAVMNGENPFVAIVKAVPQSIFDGLMVAGLSEKVFSPREQVLARGVKTNDLPSASEVPGNKNFRVTPAPEATSHPLPPEVFETLKQQGVTLKGYNPENPSFFRTTPKANGVLVGEIIQIKPSLFDTFIKKFGGDINKAPKSFGDVIYEKSTTPEEIKDNLLASGESSVQGPKPKDISEFTAKFNERKATTNPEPISSNLVETKLTPEETMNIRKDIRDLALSPEQKNAMQAAIEGSITPEVAKVLNTINADILDSASPKFNEIVKSALPSRKTLPEVPVQPERVKAYQERLKLRGGDPILVNAIITPSGKRAYGVSIGGNIGLEKVVEQFTEDHEVFHQVFQNLEQMKLFKGFDKNALLDEARTLYGDKSVDKLEEEMASDFQQYVNDRESGKQSTFFGRIKDFFDRLYASFKRLFKNEADIKEFYRTVYEGKATEETTIKNEVPTFSEKAKEQGIMDFRTESKTPSLNEKPEDITDTDKFKEWFKGSKIVDENGNPLKVYHGTNSEPFAKFDEKKIGNRDSGWFGKGFYFALSKGEASIYGKNIMPAYLNIQKPFVFQDFQDPEFGGYGFGDSLYLSNLLDFAPDIAKKMETYIYKTPSTAENNYTQEGTKINLEEYKKLVDNENIKYNKEIYEQSHGVNKQKVLEYTFEGIDGNEKRITLNYSGKEPSEQLLKHMLFDKKYGVDLSDGLYGVERKLAGHGDEFTNALKEQGYDGTMQSQHGDEYVAFSPDQIGLIDENTQLPKFNEKPSKYIPISQATEVDKDGKFWTSPGNTDSGYGSVVRNAFVDSSKLFKGTSSYDFVEERGLLTPEVKANLEAAQESDDPNIEFKITQDIAEEVLKKEGYSGAHWTSEDDLNPTQYQIWDKSAVKSKMPTEKNPEFNTGNKLEDLKKTLAHAEERTGVKAFQKIDQVINKMRSIPRSKIQLPESLRLIQERISGLDDAITFSTQNLEEHPGKKLQRFMSRKEGIFEDFRNPDLAKTPSERKAIVERNKKIMSASESAMEDTKFHDQYDDPDVIREQIEAYVREKESLEAFKSERAELKKQFRKSRDEFFTEERDRVAINSIVAKEERLKTIEEVTKILRKEGRERKEKVDAIQDYFKLTDKEMQKIRGNKDFRLVSDKEFENMLQEIQGKAYEAFVHREAVLEIENTIHEMELKKTENLREAMKMRKLENMSLNELNKFNELLQTFQPGDEFLGKRQIQTATLTDLGPIKTHREALEILAKEAGVPLTDVKEVEPKWKDKYLNDIALQKRNPLFKVMVENANKATIESAQRYHEIKKEFSELLKEARASRTRSLADRLVPTDELIYKFQEAPAEERSFLMKQMTPEEIKVAMYMKESFLKMRDTLLQQGALDRYVQNYITRMHRGLLEIIKTEGKNLFSKEGFKGLVKELWDAQHMQKVTFKILEDKTGDVLPLEKFFKYSIARTGKLTPSKNVGKVFLEYARVFEQKRQLDSFIPKLDIFSHILTPQTKTKGGLIKNDTLVTFVKQWLNNKKGRIIDVKIGSPGDPVDVAIRFGIAFTRLRDLGLNIPIGLASNVGAQLATFVPLGPKKYLSGLTRLNTKQGSKILSQHEPIVGETFKEKFTDVSKDLGEKLTEISLATFSAADRKAKSVFLLGQLTPEEFKTGNISSERLASIKLEIGRYHAVEGMKSLIGRTALGSAAMQYKTWAVPLAQSTIENIKGLKKVVQNSKEENPFKSKEVKELSRLVIMSVLLLLMGYEAYSHLKDKKNKTFLDNLAYKSMNDGLSMIGALDPSLWTKVRVLQFADDLTTSISNIIASLGTGKKPDLSTLKKTVTPSVFKQFSSGSDSTKVEDTISKSAKTAGTKLNKLDPSIVDPAKEAWDKVKEIGPGTPEADDVVSALSDNEYEAYKLVKASDEDYWSGLSDKVTPIVKKAYEVGFGTEEADTLVGELSDDEYKSYQQIKKALYGVDTGEDIVGTTPEADAAASDSFGDGPSEYSKQSFITHIVNIAKAIGSDPVETFDDIFHGDWRITGVTNGQVIVNRMSVEDSQAIKKSLGGANSKFKLDHIVPVKGGGNNQNPKNLQLIPTEQWQENTPVEKYLIKKLKSGSIDGDQLREYIIRFKAGKGQKLSDSANKEYKDKYNSQPITFDEIKNIIK